MKIKTEELRQTFSALKPGLAGSRETTEQSNSFAFQNGRAFSYNDVIAVSVVFPGDIEGAVPADALVALIGKLKGEETALEVLDDELRVQCGRTKAGITMEYDIHMPLDEIKIPKKAKWIPLSEDFLTGLKGCLASCSQDDATPILTGVNCDGNILESSDNDRASQWELEVEVFIKPVIIPQRAGKALMAFDDVVEFMEQDGWLHFRAEDETIFSCRCLHGVFPDLEPFFEVEGESISFPKSMGGILDRANVFSSIDDDLVRVSIDKKGIFQVRSESDYGWLEDTVRLKQPPKKAVSFSIVPSYLQYILGSTNTATIGDSAILFEAGALSHLIALEV